MARIEVCRNVENTSLPQRDEEEHFVILWKLNFEIKEPQRRESMRFNNKKK